MLANRDYAIEGDDEEVQLALMLDGQQIGGAVFPLEFCKGAWRLAEIMGEAYRNNTDGLTVH